MHIIHAIHHTKSIISLPHSLTMAFRFHNVQIFKSQSLGVGSYGAVYRAKCDQLPCAAKLLHLILVDPGAPRHQQRFEQECQFLSGIRHPNIVQYLGTCRDPESGLPVLLMELMDNSLTHFLEYSPEQLPFHIEVNLCQDVALAIAYLHSNGIIHRDLSSNNVLLIAGSRAKVTDFGISKLVDAAPHMTPLTQCPGTAGYMPPEAMSESPVYTYKLDCFAHGVVAIQIMTRQFPEPSPALHLVNDARSPTGTILVPVLEPERRQSHIDHIDPDHPLLPIAIRCLSYNERDRPLAEQICDHLAELKEDPQYIQSLQRAQERGRQEYSSTSDMEAKDGQIRELQRNVAVCEGEIRELHEQLDQKDKAVVASQHEIQHLTRDNQHLTQNNQQLTGDNQRLTRDNQHLTQNNQQLTQDNQQLAQDNQHLTQNNQQLTQDNQQLTRDNQRLTRDSQQLTRDNQRLTRDNQQLTRDNQRQDKHKHRQKVGEKNGQIEVRERRSKDESTPDDPTGLTISTILSRRLLKGRLTSVSLGNWAYGCVDQVEIDGKKFAAKKFKSNLCSLCKKFDSEFMILSSLDHPNIVKYQGICFVDEDPAVCRIVMEEMKTSLHQYLLHNEGIAVSMKLSILRDVASGLAYLHSQDPAVIHRDLTAKNVLLTARPHQIAKIADFGNSRIADIESGEQKTTANIPGTFEYMPPEAQSSHARYSRELDCFSFGHLALFTATQKYPRYLLPPKFYAEGSTKLHARSEIQRRQEYLDELHVLIHDHPLVNLIKRCLDDSPANRPSAKNLTSQLTQLCDCCSLNDVVESDTESDTENDSNTDTTTDNSATGASSSWPDLL